MKVTDCMTREVQTVGRDATLQDASRWMADRDAGFLPVTDGNRLIGIVTDRDIAVRGVARGRGPQDSVTAVMSDDIKYCFDDQDIDEVMANMGNVQLRRLPVVNRDKTLVGIISIGDMAANGSAESVGKAIGGISRQGTAPSQPA